MQVACSYCAARVDLDHRSAGKTIRCTECGKSFIAPAELALTGQRHLLTNFSVATLMLLHFVTAGFFTLVHLSMMHERMPRLRKNDPTATVAAGLCFVPGFNLYWFAFNFYRLCVRINEQRAFAGLGPQAPEWLAVVSGVLLATSASAAFLSSAGVYALGAIGMVVLPFFAILVQLAVNDLCEEEQQPAGNPVLA